jgi:predicted alpha-1,2-mannosidase
VRALSAGGAAATVSGVRLGRGELRRRVACVVGAVLVVGGCSSWHGSTRPTSAHVPNAVTVSPSALVNPFMGTGVGGRAVGHVDASPAADVPFGMMQWGPDTSPYRADGGGYSFGDSALSGLSLTHLNGPGCPGLGDIPILPTIGPTVGLPELATAHFSHRFEHAVPGSYSVTLAGSGIKFDVAVTTRTGIARFAFPRTASANVVFKVADSAVAGEQANVRVIGDHEVAGQVVSGQFCGTSGSYTLAFDAQFERPFRQFATWRGVANRPGTRTISGAHSGATVTFDTRETSAVRMKVGISFVGVADARANLAAENPGWDYDAIAQAATKRWDDMLDRVAVTGGSARTRATFYSAMYRSLLHPNVFDDTDGAYRGFDGRVHVAHGYTQYANFSGWDIYRSEIPLLALVAPSETSDMVRSLLADHDQSGWLPKWAFTDVETAEMNGDSADPIIASAYAFGARRFDVSAALRAMVAGATTAGTGLGWDVERQDLDQYLSQGWVAVDRRDRTSFDYTIGGSETLEYAIDDAAIAQLAVTTGDQRTARTFVARAGNWRHLLNSATHWLSARTADGRFPPGPAFQVSPLPGIGQDGWEEGNSIQYSWSVPQDLRGLFDAMGGNAVVVARLDAFFTQLNSSRKQPFDWAGNEPSLGIPWEYDYAGAPWRTQDVVRRIATQLYSATPGGEPGNDDLGALSSWYVWAAIGLYPETPGRADLVLASPMFARVSIALGSGKTITINAPRASDTSRYVQHAQVDGISAPPSCTNTTHDYECPWLPASVLTSGGTLDLSLGTTPNTSWGTANAAAPPSLSARRNS